MRRAVIGAMVVMAALVASPAAAGQPAWPPADQATIRPGAATVTAETTGCTANFVFWDATDVYLGYAAHCAQVSAAGISSSEYCRTPSMPLGTAVEIEGATRPGRLAYSSFQTMTDVREQDPGACNENDFALVRLDPADHGRVNPSVPFWGGPTGVRRSAVAEGEKVLAYGNSSLRGGIEPLKPKEGVKVYGSPEGWGHVVYFATPGIFGDSGSGVMDGAGAATGVLVTLTLAMPGGNGVSDLAHVLDYMRAHGGPDVRLAMGTESFRGPLSGTGPVEPPAPEPEPAPTPAPTPAPAPTQPAPAGASPPAAPATAPPAGKRHRKTARCRRRTRNRRAHAAKRRRCHHLSHHR